LPILKTKKALAQMEAGEVLTVLATDGGAPGDFEAFCRQTGHVLLESREEDGVFTLVVNPYERSSENGETSDFKAFDVFL